jgi:predicted secreted protein
MSTTVKFPAKSAKAKVVKITFEVAQDAAQDAAKIELLCDFNGWDPVALKKSTAKKTAGSFSATIEIPVAEIKDSYQYRFHYVMADGSEKYDNDWNADEYCANPFGGENSVVVVKEDK